MKKIREKEIAIEMFEGKIGEKNIKEIRIFDNGILNDKEYRKLKNDILENKYIPESIFKSSELEERERSLFIAILYHYSIPVEFDGEFRIYKLLHKI